MGLIQLPQYILMAVQKGNAFVLIQTLKNKQQFTLSLIHTSDQSEIHCIPIPVQKEPTDFVSSF